MDLNEHFHHNFSKAIERLGVFFEGTNEIDEFKHLVLQGYPFKVNLMFSTLKICEILQEHHILVLQNHLGCISL